MNAGKKWIRGTSPSQGISAAARRGLSKRLGHVWHWLPSAAKRAGEDVEYVHQLRVSIRRAVAALDAFAPLLPPKKTRWMRKRLKRVRRKAGPARDYDVLLERLARDGAAHGEKQKDLVRYVAQLRREAQDAIVKAYRRMKRRDLPRRMDQLANRAAWRENDAEPSFADYAQMAIRPVLDDFFLAAGTDLSDAEAMHEFRLAGKKLRYAMELFAGAMPKAFRSRLYPRIADLQERLGEVSDHDTACRGFESWGRAAPNKHLAKWFHHMMTAEQQAFQQGQARFLDWWTPRACQDMREEFDDLAFT